MKKIITILIILIPLCIQAQKQSRPIHGLDKLPTIQGTQDALRGYITKENEAKHDWPFSLIVKSKSEKAVSIQLTISKTNEFTNIADVFVYSQQPSHNFWIPVQPLNQSASNLLYSINLPVEIAKKSFIALACDKDKNNSLPQKHPHVFLRHFYKKIYEIRLGSYISTNLPRQHREEKKPDKDKTINIKIDGI
ncbi:hypothetical protein ACFLS1_11950 [Verrucomicrobiota bacterium]